MTNKLILFAVMILISCNLMAQQAAPTTYTVKGILLDSLTQEPEPYATIRIVNKATPKVMAKMAVTDNKGKFQEKVTGSGNYVITITSIGKSTVVKEFTLAPAERTVDFGTLYTSDAANELGTVEVIAQKPLVKVDLDKIEYNVEDDPDSKTNSVLEMLRKVPLVTVDGEDNIQVNGSSSFKVHVNGKPNNMMSDNPTEVLKSMPANSIKHIEVITNPGAKYDAEGVGGVLNIVTVGGGFEGYTATFSGNATNMGGGGSIYATIKQNKLTLTGNYSVNYNKQPRNYNYGEYENESENTIEYSDGWSKNKHIFQHGNIEASYELDTLRLFTLSFGLYGGNNDSYGNTNVWMNQLASSALSPIYQYDRATNGDNSWYSIRGSFDYQRLFSVKDRMLTFSYRINSQPRTSDSDIKYLYDEDEFPESWITRLRLYNQRSDGEQSTTEHTFQGDYVTPIGKYHSVEAGLKYIIRDNRSDNDRYTKEVYDNEYSSHYKHLNDIFAAYTGYSLKYKKLMAKAGVRYERTMQDVKYHEKPERNFKVNFNDVVPSASIGMKIGQMQNLRFGYDMRIRRPSIGYLNPYLDDSNPTYIRQGNPNLESEKSHRLSLSFSSFTQQFNLNLSLRHSFNNNSIENITELRDPSTIPGLNPSSPEKVLYATYDNIGKSSNTGLSAYVNWNASPRTRIYMNANGGYSKFKGNSLTATGDKIENDGWDLFLYGGIQHSFPKDFRVGLNLMGATPRISLQGRGSGFYDYGINVNKSFLKQRLTLSAFANNIFTEHMTHKNSIEGNGFRQSSEFKYSRRRFGVSISYRIGELRAQVKKAVRTISNDDVKSGDSEGGSSQGSAN